MRYRVKDYTIEGQMIILPYEITLEDLRLLTNETQEISLCSSMFKNKALIKKDGIWTEIPNAISISGNIITVTLEACTLQSTDKLTIEIDNGDNLSSVENKMEEESLTIQNKIDNIKLPEIDTTELAKQGENPEATLTAIYKLLIGSNEPSPDIPEGVAERLALILEFFGMKPIEAYEFMTAEEVCSELGEIMTSMDLDFTPEQAKEITNNTLNKEY